MSGHRLTATRSNYADEHSSVSQMEMPLAWPIRATPDDAGDAQSPLAAVGIGHAVALLIGAVGFAGTVVALVYMVSFALRRRRRDRRNNANVGRIRPQPFGGARTGSPKVAVNAAPRLAPAGRDSLARRKAQEAFEASLREILDARSGRSAA